MAITGAQQAGLYYLRRRSRSQRFIAQATPWSSGLVVSAGDIVQSNNMAWQALNSGTTAGSESPDNSQGAVFVDAGGVSWVHLPLLLTAPAAVG